MKLNMFSGTLYVKVHKNAITVRHVEKNEEATLAATRPFTTDRLLVGQFSAAQALLKEAMDRTYRARRLSPAPIVVIQPMAMSEGGLSEVEERVLHELATAAGARKAIVWVGSELSDEEVLAKAESA